MKAIVFLAVLLVGAIATNSIHNQLVKDLFAQWKITHQKSYKAGHEENLRLSIFAKNYASILKFNQVEKGVTLALNQFADLTSEEFGKIYTGLNVPVTKKTHHNLHQVHHSHKVQKHLKDLPVSVDWRTKGAVTNVKNQGACGSCWAFSTTGTLEGFYFINHGSLLSFSEQNLVDCVTADAGCQGGLMSDALAYTAQGGIETEADYPYTGRDQKCAYDSSKAVKVNAAYQNVTANNVDALKTAIAAGPVAVAIQANQLVFQFYAGGVIKKFCGDKLDHGVLAVGYDNIKGDDAFIVKNSWGSGWGNSGYVYIAIDGTANKGAGVCGILAMASYATN